MTTCTRSPAPAALVAAAVVSLLAGCDETVTTAPEEPPAETAVEAAPAIEEWEVIFDEWEACLSSIPMAPSDCTRTTRSTTSRRERTSNAAFPPDAETLKHLPWLANREVVPTYETVNWTDFTVCAECELQLTEVVRLGDPAGPGAIEGAAPGVTWSEHLGYVVASSTFLQIFDHDGRFVRRVGREGEGPGEFTAIADAHVVDGRLVALDRVTRAWSNFNLAGEFLGRRPYGHQAGAFVPVGGGRVVVVNRDAAPEADDAPLHLAHIDSGVPSLHFGSKDAWEYGWKERPHAGDVRGSVTGRPGTLWWGAAGGPRLQEWSVDDELLRVIEGELPWFPEVRRPVDLTREPPPTLLRFLALDTTEHLWMITRTADPDWREVELETGQQGLRVPAGKQDNYFDTRLDIFDLEEKRHIGRYVWDAAGARLFNLGGEPAASIVEYAEDTERQVVIYRLDRRKHGLGVGSAVPLTDLARQPFR